jgi:hypothetical protein
MPIIRFQPVAPSAAAIVSTTSVDVIGSTCRPSTSRGIIIRNSLAS